MRIKTKPVEKEAVQWDGFNEEEMKKFFNKSNLEIDSHSRELLVRTLEGIMRAGKTDWIIKGVAGEYYPCKNEIFHKNYDILDDKPTDN